MQKEVRILFQLGQVVITPGAEELLEKYGKDPLVYVERHHQGDFGLHGNFYGTKLSEEEAREGPLVTSEDAKLNKYGVMHRDRILSAYEVGGERLWVITDAGHQVTTLLLPEEY